MHVCPKCGSMEEFCEHADLEKGEVDKYYCNSCGYESTEMLANKKEVVAV
jgi:ribosomal protein S27AE